ncbi:hypothetical protein WOLCODRAFT_165599, partial [Wolfiporia cocos MD-104 SS10]
MRAIGRLRRAGNVSLSSPRRRASPPRSLAGPRRRPADWLHAGQPMGDGDPPGRDGRGMQIGGDGAVGSVDGAGSAMILSGGRRTCCSRLGAGPPWSLGAVAPGSPVGTIAVGDDAGIAPMTVRAAGDGRRRHGGRGGRDAVDDGPGGRVAAARSRPPRINARRLGANRGGAYISWEQ